MWEGLVSFGRDYYFVFLRSYYTINCFFLDISEPQCNASISNSMYREENSNEIDEYVAEGKLYSRPSQRLAP